MRAVQYQQELTELSETLHPDNLSLDFTKVVYEALCGVAGRFSDKGRGLARKIEKTCLYVGHPVFRAGALGTVYEGAASTMNPNYHSLPVDPVLVLTIGASMVAAKAVLLYIRNLPRA
jgi:hypothetical protein